MWKIDIITRGRGEDTDEDENLNLEVIENNIEYLDKIESLNINFWKLSKNKRR